MFGRFVERRAREALFGIVLYDGADIVPFGDGLAAALFEYPLDDGGKVDYALFDRQGRALAVLEAESTSVNLSAGEAQAGAMPIGVLYVPKDMTASYYPENDCFPDKFGEVFYQCLVCPVILSENQACGSAMLVSRQPTRISPCSAMHSRQLDASVF
jgi:hypothetical protein